ncbi:MAG: DUF6432 family protein [Halobacteriaceae archaeon]
MKAREQVRDRPDPEVAVLDAVVERGQDGITVLELRAHSDVPIDDLEEALSELKEDDLIHADEEDGRTVIRPDERAVPDGEPHKEQTFIDKILAFLERFR